MIYGKLKDTSIVGLSIHVPPTQTLALRSYKSFA